MILLSAQFGALCIVAIFALRLLRGRARWLAFFTVNALFLSSHLSPAGMVSTALFAASGYAAARLAPNLSKRGLAAAIALVTLAFLALRGYDLAGFSLLSGWLSKDWRGAVIATIGLSFLYFKMLHVIIDSAGGTLGELRLSTYTNYVFNFTAFLMGPIQRYQHFAEQWAGREPALAPGWEPQLDAVLRIFRGLIKTFVLAEVFGGWILGPEVAIEELSRPELAGRVYAYYFYLYFDFSGYCDVMIGVGSLMGIRPPENFHLPFFSRNVSEYWLRVHRSLTEWLTDYVFNPTYAGALRSRDKFGGTQGALALALMLTMLVAGAWHGTTLSFLVFGVVHGVFLVCYRLYEQRMIKRMGRRKFRTFSDQLWVRALGILLTYNITSVAYLFFVLEPAEVANVIARVLGW